MLAELDLAPRRLLLDIYDAALRAVNGRISVSAALRVHPIDGEARIFAIGKAAESMTLGALDVLGSQCGGGLLVTKEGHLESHRLRDRGIETLIAGHPVPTQASLVAGQRLLALASTIPPGTTPLFLISGGASSLVEVLSSGLGLDELRRMNQWLLGSGLPIDAMNLARKSVSRIKGGGLLAQLTGKNPRVLAISDVPGDDPRVIGSGLLVPDPELAQEALTLDLPEWLAEWVNGGLAERGPSPGRGPEVELVATIGKALRAAADHAEARGLAVTIHDRLLQGDAADSGRKLAQALRDASAGLHLWGGETTVRLPPEPGRGGRNQHLALAAAIELTGRDDCFLLSAGTDGTDGPTEDAGALVDGQTIERAECAGLEAPGHLLRADSGSLLEASGDLIRTGPTGTNVMDLVLGLKH